MKIDFEDLSYILSLCENGFFKEGKFYPNKCDESVFVEIDLECVPEEADYELR